MQNVFGSLSQRHVSDDEVESSKYVMFSNATLPVPATGDLPFHSAMEPYEKTIHDYVKLRALQGLLMAKVMRWVDLKFIHLNTHQWPFRYRVVNFVIVKNYTTFILRTLGSLS